MTAVKIENMTCGQCGMLVEPAMAFHPFLYCRLFQLGILDPARFLNGQHFIPDPEHWGDDAPRRQADAIRWLTAPTRAESAAPSLEPTP